MFAKDINLRQSLIQEVGLNQFFDKVTNSEVEKIVILYKNRFIRFGYELIENLCDKQGTAIEVIDHTEKTEEPELVEALIPIVTVFSCILQGKGTNKTKKMIKELIEKDTCEESKNKNINFGNPLEQPDGLIIGHQVHKKKITSTVVNFDLTAYFVKNQQF